MQEAGDRTAILPRFARISRQQHLPQFLSVLWAKVNTPEVLKARYAESPQQRNQEQLELSIVNLSDPEVVAEFLNADFRAAIEHASCVMFVGAELLLTAPTKQLLSHTLLQ